MSRARHIIATLISAPLLATLLGCAQPEVPSDHFYRLNTPQVSPGPVVLSGALQVERLTADGVTARRAMVYSDAGAGNELREYHYHYWAEPPGIMLQRRLVDFLRAAGAATDVVTPDLRVRPDYVLSGRIHRFERITGVGPKIAVAIELIIKRTEDDDLILLRTYKVVKSHPVDTMRDAVRAFDGALAEILNQLLSDLKTL